MDGLKSFSRVITDSTQELCSSLESSYIEKVKEICKNGERSPGVNHPKKEQLEIVAALFHA